MVLQISYYPCGAILLRTKEICCGQSDQFSSLSLAFDHIVYTRLFQSWVDDFLFFSSPGLLDFVIDHRALETTSFPVHIFKNLSVTTQFPLEAMPFANYLVSFFTSTFWYSTTVNN